MLQHVSTCFNSLNLLVQHFAHFQHIEHVFSIFSRRRRHDSVRDVGVAGPLDHAAARFKWGEVGRLRYIDCYGDGAPRVGPPGHVALFGDDRVLRRTCDMAKSKKGMLRTTREEDWPPTVASQEAAQDSGVVHPRPEQEDEEAYRGRRAEG